MVVNMSVQQRSKDVRFEGDTRTFLPSGPYIPVDQIPNELKKLLFGDKRQHKITQITQIKPALKPEEVRTVALLAQVALVVFIIVSLILILCLFCICCYEIRSYFVRRKRQRQRRHEVLSRAVSSRHRDVGPRRQMTRQMTNDFDSFQTSPPPPPSPPPPQEEEVPKREIQNQHQPIFKKCSVKSVGSAYTPTAPTPPRPSSSSTSGSSRTNFEPSPPAIHVNGDRFANSGEDNLSMDMDRSMRSYCVYEEMATMVPEYHQPSASSAQSSNFTFDECPDAPVAIISRERRHLTRY